MKGRCGLRSQLLIIGLALVSVGCGKKMQSAWVDRTVIVDGYDTEWEGARFHLEDANAGIGLLNDDKDLYVCLSLSDPAAQLQVLRGGLTIWFDPQGKKNKRVGIRFPVGLSAGGEHSGRRPDFEGRPRGGFREERGNEGRTSRGERLQRLFARVTENGQMEILGPNLPYDIRRVGLDQDNGVRLQVSFEHGRLVYEIRMPLQHLAAGGTLGEKVGLGFETPKLDVQQMRQRARGGFEGGMGGGRGGGAGMGRGPMGGGRMGGMARGSEGPGAQPIQFWSKVVLARRN